MGKYITGLVSLIVPIFNSQRYLKDLLDSLSNQTYSNFEVIFINDGSTDNSFSTLKTLLECTSYKHKLFNTSNNGPSNARNIGINNAVGEYLVFIDSDDILSPVYLEKMVKLISEGYDAVCCDYLEFSEIPLQYKKLSRYKKLSIMPKILALDIVLALKPISHCCFIFKTEILNDYNIRYSINFTYGEDTLFLVEYLNMCVNNITVMNEKLLFRRKREGSLTSIQQLEKNYETYIIDAMNSRYEMKKILDNNKLNYVLERSKFILPRMMISILNNLAISCEKAVYTNFIKQYKCKSDLSYLISFPDKKVQIAYSIFILSPSLYRRLLKGIGR